MRVRRPDLRPLTIALVAIAGLFSAVGEASACATEAIAQATKACCGGRPSSECGCCTSPGETYRAGEPGRSLAYPEAAGVEAPGRSCECRSSDPATPSKPESKTPENRSDEARGGPLRAIVSDRSAVVARLRLLLPNASPPEFPHYLRTSRLLF